MFNAEMGTVDVSASKGRVDMRAAMDDPSPPVYMLGLVTVRTADLSAVCVYTQQSGH